MAVKTFRGYGLKHLMSNIINMFIYSTVTLYNNKLFTIIKILKRRNGEHDYTLYRVHFTCVYPNCLSDAPTHDLEYIRGFRKTI